MPLVKVWIHFVWSTKNRFPYLTDSIRTQVFDHIYTNARSKGILLDTIGGYIDHMHALVLLRNNQTISRTVQLMKGESSFWVNKNKLTEENFEWQNDYYVESVDEARLNTLRKYITNQEDHHRHKSSGGV